ncbi:MAG: sodium ion-translocating decarboxylase subunit beta [Opitutales bacterium]|nr:sodium ion-translocating decarboxylase subunit beta [Opitutales bacterium]
MWVVVGVLFYLAVKKEFEPLLLVPIAFGALLANLPSRGLTNKNAAEVAAPITGTVLYSFATMGDEVKLEGGVRLHRPEFVGDRMDEAELEHVLSDMGGLLYVIRPDSIAEGTEIKPIAGELNGQPIQLQTRDYFVWADAAGLVCGQDISAPGTKVYKGEVLLDMHSEGFGGLFDFFYKGISNEIFPPLIFLGVGALTDFGPLIANPITLLLGGAAQFGVFATFFGAIWIFGFTSHQAAAIGIIGGADGPTSIFLSNKLAPELLAPIAVAAYSYMALVPVIQPPIMRALTTMKERKIRMQKLRDVSKLEKLVFAIVVAILCILVVPDASALIAMLMLGNFLRECGVTERLVKAAQNEIINIVTIFLGASVGITMTADRFLKTETLGILAMGIVAFSVSTAAGIIMAKFFNFFLKNKINPLIGSAGVSAVPMAARVSQVEGQKADPRNFLLMHAMGPNVAGVIGTAVAAGFFIATLGH